MMNKNDNHIFYYINTIRKKKTSEDSGLIWQKLVYTI